MCTERANEGELLHEFSIDEWLTHSPGWSQPLYVLFFAEWQRLEVT